MLVLSRKETEQIKLGDDIVLTIVRVSKDRVRIGIEAPDNILVLRAELPDQNFGHGLELNQKEAG